MSKYVSIYGVSFEVIKPRKYDYSKVWESIFNLDNCRTLNECYARPSETKVNIYHFWREWFKDNSRYDDDVDFSQFGGVSSYNTFSFSLRGIIVYKGIRYVVEITPYHYRLIRV